MTVGKKPENKFEWNTYKQKNVQTVPKSNMVTEIRNQIINSKTSEAPQTEKGKKKQANSHCIVTQQYINKNK